MPYDREDPSATADSEKQERSLEDPETRTLGEPVQVLTETVQGVRQWSLAILLHQEGEEHHYRVSFGKTEELVPRDRVRFFPATAEAVSPEALYRQGMVAAGRVYGDEVRDYDRVLCGLCHVLGARGITLTPVQLSNYFHCPLASYSRDYTLVGVIKGMHTTLTSPASASTPSWDQEQVLKRQLYGYRRYQPLDDLIDEDDLSRYLSTLREALTANPTCRGTLPHRLTKVRQEAWHIQEKCTIVEALLGTETEALRAEREFVAELLAAADHLETRLRDKIAAVEDRLAALPVERAGGLQPIATLKYRRSIFVRNAAELDGRYLTDGHLLIPKSAVRGGARRLRSLTYKGYQPEEEASADVDGAEGGEQTKPITRTSDQVCDTQFQRIVSEADLPATLLGYFTYRRRSRQKDRRIIEQKIALAATADDEVVFLGADYVRFIDSVVGGFDTIMARIETAGPAARRPGTRFATAVVFFRGDEPLAVLMPLRYTLEEIPIDIARARQQLRLDGTARQLVPTWLELGRQVPWLFRFFQDQEDLAAQLLEHDRHELGAAFALGEVCCINLGSRSGVVEEWLIIKGRTVIGNVPLRVRDDLGDLNQEKTAQKIRAITALLRTATEEQCAAEDFLELL